MKLFLDSDQIDQFAFRQWARENYEPLSPIPGIWHPIVQDECAKINQEFSDGSPSIEEILN